jgi:hypothetical protein
VRPPIAISAPLTRSHPGTGFHVASLHSMPVPSLIGLTSSAVGLKEPLAHSTRATTEGISLGSARISGDLDCSGATLETEGRGALSADNLQVGGNVLPGGFKATATADRYGWAHSALGFGHSARRLDPRSLTARA